MDSLKQIIEEMRLSADNWNPVDDDEFREWASRLEYLHARLKSGEYDGTDIMNAWIAVEELIELRELQEKMADILSRTAIALRGPEPELTRWSWHDIPDRAAAAIAVISAITEKT